MLLVGCKCAAVRVCEYSTSIISSCRIKRSKWLVGHKVCYKICLSEQHMSWQRTNPVLISHFVSDSVLDLRCSYSKVVACVQFLCCVTVFSTTCTQVHSVEYRIHCYGYHCRYRFHRHNTSIQMRLEWITSSE